MSIGKTLGFFAAFIIPGLAVLGLYMGSFWQFSTLLFVFGLIPVLDWLVSTDTSNVSAEKEPKLWTAFFYSFVLYVWAYLQLIYIVWACYVAATMPLNGAEFVLFAVTSALVTGGIGITVAHELGHKKEPVKRFYSQLILLSVHYMHFYIEHNKGHHVYVSTPQDPATSRRGESFYRFWLRSVVGSYLSAWRIENKRLERMGLGAFHYKNAMIWYAILPFVFMLCLFLGLSWYAEVWLFKVLYFWLLQSVLAFSLLEMVNYIEHYGLQRRLLPSGHYERVTHLHSWNASHLVSNFFLFQLQRHSDHHESALRPYQVLRHFDESPQLPTGYTGMILLSLLPPAWFRIMDKRLDEWQQKQMVELVVP